MPTGPNPSPVPDEDPHGGDGDTFNFLTPDLVERYLDNPGGYLGGPYGPAVYEQLDLVYDVFVDNQIEIRYNQQDGFGGVVEVVQYVIDGGDWLQIRDGNLRSEFRSQMDDYFSSNAEMNAWIEDQGMTLL